MPRKKRTPRTPPITPPETPAAAPSESTPPSLEEQMREAIPPTWNLFSPNVETFQKMVNEGKDPTWARVMLWKIQGSGDETRLYEEDEDETSSWDAARISLRWVRETFGSGRYRVQVFNPQNQSCGHARITIEGPRDRLPSGKPKPATPAPSTGDELRDRLVTMALENIARPQSRTEPMGEAVAGMATLMSTFQANQAQMLQMQMQVLQEMKREPPPPTPKDPLRDGLLEKLLAERLSITAAPKSAGLSRKEAIELIEFGRKSAGKSAEDSEEWVEIIRDLLDTAKPLAAAWAVDKLGDKAGPILAKMAADAAKDEEEDDEDEGEQMK